MSNTVTKLLVPLLSMMTLFMISVAMSEEQNQLNIDSNQQLRQQERQRQLQQQQETKPDVTNATQNLKNMRLVPTDQTPEQETPCFTISRITLVGESASTFQFALDHIINEHQKSKPILGRCLGVRGINVLMNQVQNVIIEKGFITTRVLATPQNLSSGELELTVIPGKVNSIRFAPESNHQVTDWNAVPISTGDALNLRDIEQALENFKRVPTVEADIQIEPAMLQVDGTSNTPLLGYSDLVIKYQQRFPIRASISVDDSGFKTTGKYLGNMTLSGDNLLSLNDLFYISYNHDLGGGESGKRGTQGVNAHYSVPWDYWLLGFNTSHNQYHQTVVGASQNYLYSGVSQNNELKLQRLIFRNQINKTTLSLKGFLRKSQNYIDDTEIEVQRRRTAGWECGINQSWYIGSAVLEYQLSYRRGTGAMNALKAPEEPFGEGTSRMKLWLTDINYSVPFSVVFPWGQQPL